MLTHQNLLCGIANNEYAGHIFNETDVYLSYAPFSHIFEQLMAFGFSIIYGIQVGFISPGDLQSNLISDMRAL